MRAILEEYGSVFVLMILGSGIIALLMMILRAILTGEIWQIWT